MAAHQPADHEMGAIVHRIAHIYLEVERGMRPPQHLRKLLTRTEYERHRQVPLQDRLPTTGPVVTADIGRIRFDRDRHGNVTAAVPTREVDDRWGSLIIHLLNNDKGWTVDYLQRIPRRGLTHDEQRSEPQPTSLTDAIRRADTERRLVRAAHIAVDRRIGELSSGPDTDDVSVGELREQRRQWSRLLDEREHELELLRGRRDARETLLPGQDPSPQHDGPDPDEQVHDKLTQILGPPPDDDHHREMWAEVRAEITTYRQRWEITNTGTILGPEPSQPDQQRDHARVAQLLLETARQLRNHASRDAEPSRQAGIELERDDGLSR